VLDVAGPHGVADPLGVPLGVRLAAAGSAAAGRHEVAMVAELMWQHVKQHEGARLVLGPQQADVTILLIDPDL
jgi:hypothetical protein